MGYKKLHVFDSYHSAPIKTLAYTYLPPISMSFHRIRNFDEPSNIGTRKQARKNVPAREVFTRMLASSIQADL